jgi:hypothetical protein
MSVAASPVSKTPTMMKSSVATKVIPTSKPSTAKITRQESILTPSTVKSTNAAAMSKATSAATLSGQRYSAIPAVKKQTAIKAAVTSGNNYTAAAQSYKAKADANAKLLKAKADKARADAAKKKAAVKNGTYKPSKKTGSK